MARDAAPPDMPPEVVRRAPFADNPQVGARGQRTQQRILDAALEVFGESGYHECGIDSIATRAGCSRAAFYQYFSSKEDVFRHLAGQVARQLDASHEALEPLRADRGGLALDSRLGRAPLRDLQPLRARVPRLSGGLGERRRGGERLGALGAARGLADPLPDRDPCDPVAPARPADPAAPRVRHAHARRGEDPPLGRAGALRGGPRLRRARGRDAPEPLRAPCGRPTSTVRPRAGRRSLRFDPILRAAFAQRDAAAGSDRRPVAGRGKPCWRPAGRRSSSAAITARASAT